MRKLQAVIGVVGEVFDPGHFTEGKKLPTVTREEPTPLPDLHKKAQAALLECGHTSRLGIVVENDNGIVVLRGMVTTYYAKQMVQEAVRPVLLAQTPHGVVRNLIEVILIKKDT